MPCATVICIHVLPRLTPARISRLAGSAEMATRKGMIVRSLDTDVELLARHVSILKVVMKEQPIGIIKLAELTKLPEHKVRYSLRILEREGLVAFMLALTDETTEARRLDGESVFPEDCG